MRVDACPRNLSLIVSFYIVGSFEYVCKLVKTKNKNKRTHFILMNNNDIEV